MLALKAASLYFALVFAAGFALGLVRVLWVVPRFGTRLAELMELPIMLAISFVAARWVVRRLRLPFGCASRLRMGFAALGLLLVAEFGFVLWLRGISITEYLAAQDPVSRAAYYVALGAFALMPLLVRNRRISPRTQAS